jgi:hypothetical protein
LALLLIYAFGCKTSLNRLQLPPKHDSSLRFSSNKNMAELPKGAIISIIVVAAAAAVVIAWAIHSNFTGRRNAQSVNITHNEQDQTSYMKDVRMRNHHTIAASNGLLYPSFRHDEV